MINVKRPLWRMTGKGMLFVLIGCLAGGCVDSTDRLPPPKVETVTAYGMTLDESATPKQVAYVLLRSLAEDVKASQAQPPDREAQREANLITWSVAAPNVIEQRILATARQQANDPNRYKSLGENRKQEIYRVVNLWAPIVAYYVGSIDKDPQAAMERMQVQSSSEERVAHVFYEVWPDASRPDADRHQTLDIELVKEKGEDGKEYWRVARVGYRAQATGAATAPTQ